MLQLPSSNAREPGISQRWSLPSPEPAHVEIVAGIDHQGTSAEGLRDLLAAAAPNGRVIVFHNRLPFTFHPKVYLFKSPGAAELLIGSGNLAEGGLFTNYEASLRLTLDLADPDQATIPQSIEHVLDIWADSPPAPPTFSTQIFLPT